MTTTDHPSGALPDTRRAPGEPPEAPSIAGDPERDAHAEPVILTACTDGPILVRGEVEIRDSSGRPVPRRRATVALCRCGASAIKPFCDGSHKAIGFRTDDEVPRPPEPVPADEDAR